MMGDVLLAGTAVSRRESIGTLYRAVAGGDWRPVEGIPLNTGVYAITPHDRLAGVVFAATSSGIYKSFDSGQQWQKLDLPDSAGKEFWALSVHPQNPDTLFAGCSPVGIYRSDDCGATWKFCGTPRGGEERIPGLPWPTKRSRVMRIAFDRANPDLMFAAVEINGFILSEDGGNTWRDASSELVKLAANPRLKNHIVSKHDFEGLIDGHAVCTSSAAPGSVVYACRVGLFATDDLGKTWRNLNVGDYAPIDYGRDVWTAIDDPNTLYTALSLSSRAEGTSVGAMYRSPNLGRSWERVDSQVSPRSTVMGMRVHVADPNKLIDVTRGGQVFWTTDRCLSWHESQLPVEAGDAYCAAII